MSDSESSSEDLDITYKEVPQFGLMPCQFEPVESAPGSPVQREAWESTQASRLDSGE